MTAYGTVSWGLINWATGLPSTSATVMTPVADTPLLDGNYLVTGLPRRFIPSNGTASWSAVVEQGNYRLDVEGQPYLDSIYFAMPGDAGSYGISDIRLSGGNTFVQSGIQKLTSADNSVRLTPSTGVGVVDLAFTGTASAGGISKVYSSDASVSVVTTSGTANCKITPGSVVGQFAANGDADLSGMTTVTLPGPAIFQDVALTLDAAGVLGVYGSASQVTQVGSTGQIVYTTRYVVINTSGVSLTLPALSSLSTTYPNGVEITLINSSSGNVTVAAGGGDSISPGGTVTFGAGHSVALKAFGQVWYIIGGKS